MPAELISLDQASWRVEKSGIPGQAFAELLLNGEPPLIGLRPGHKLREHGLRDPQRAPGPDSHGHCLERHARERTRRPLWGQPRHSPQGKTRRTAVVVEISSSTNDK